jgi:List-Bact-rpt repeat protein
VRGERKVKRRRADRRTAFAAQTSTASKEEPVVGRLCRTVSGLEAGQRLHTLSLALFAILTGSVLIGAGSASAAQLTLTWTDTSVGDASFKVQRKTGTTGTYAQIGATGVGTTTYLDSSVTVSTTYCYRVQATNAFGDSGFSNEACGAAAPGFDLTVTKTGSGSGTVLSSPAGITCGADCLETYTSGTAVTLTATAASGSTFGGWTGGGCSGTAPCVVASNTPITVSAAFGLATPSTAALTIQKSGTGSGTVTSQPAGVSCGTTCGASFVTGTAVTLTATAGAGSVFAGWGGAADCSDGAVTMSAALTCTATFQAAPPVTLTVQKLGEGSGTVSSQPAGISCGAACGANFASGTRVTLSAAANTGSVFSGWSGGADCSDGSVTMSAALTCVATFHTLSLPTTPSPPPPTPTPTPTPAPVEILVDNGAAGTHAYGQWSRSVLPTSFGASSLYSSGRWIDHYRWTPRLPAAGRYEVWVWWTSAPNRSPKAQYVVAHSGGTAVITRDQRTGGGQWQLLGTYAFTAGARGFVQLSDANGGVVSADAVRFVKK